MINGNPYMFMYIIHIYMQHTYYIYGHIIYIYIIKGKRWSANISKKTQDLLVNFLSQVKANTNSINATVH